MAKAKQAQQNALLTNEMDWEYLCPSCGHWCKRGGDNATSVCTGCFKEFFVDRQPKRRINRNED